MMDREDEKNEWSGNGVFFHQGVTQSWEALLACLTWRQQASSTRSWCPGPTEWGPNSRWGEYERCCLCKYVAESWSNGEQTEELSIRLAPIWLWLTPDRPRNNNSETGSKFSCRVTAQRGGGGVLICSRIQRLRLQRLKIPEQKNKFH